MCVMRISSASRSRLRTSAASEVCGVRRAFTEVFLRLLCSAKASKPANMTRMSAVSNELESKSARLRDSLKKLGRTLVAYSGGVDSAYLAWAAHEALGEKMLAIIADSPSLARTQLADAVAFAEEQSIPLEVIATSE